MAIIRCPECNHEISDKAPSCPSCGAPIAGHVVTCPVCGKTYFNDRAECPQCHHKTKLAPTATVDESPAENLKPVPQTEPSEKVQAAPAQYQPEADQTEQNHTSRNNKLVVGIALLVVLVVCCICYMFYSSTQSEKEAQAYELAMASNDPQVLQNYLDQYADAPEAHRDSIQSHLDMLMQLDRDWTNVLVSGSKSDFQRYIDQHPDSPFKQIALHKIDSLDWVAANSTNTVESIELYLEQHPDGEYVDEANGKIKSLNSSTVQPEDKMLVSGVFSGFFQSLNSHDEDGLTTAFNPAITKFLGKSNATRSDVVTFMHKIYKPDVSSMSWQSLGDYNISKKEIGDQQYEFTVTFTATQNITHTDNSTSEAKFRFNAKINPDGRITELNMVKILE